MNADKAKRVKDNALSIIDAALAILNKVPTLENGGSVDLSIQTAINPFAFLMELFKTTTGYDYMIRILGYFISGALPAIELSTKAMLLSHIQNLFADCNINPLITDQLLREGITVSLPEIDVLDTLKYSPLSRNGKHYYFGCSHCKTADDIRDTAYLNRRGSTVGGGGNENLSDVFFGTRDMNALLWFMKNRSAHREVWGRKSAFTERDGVNDKQKKKDGIITLEYAARPQSLRDATGGQYYDQNPAYDMLHVFIGNVMPAGLLTAEVGNHNIKNMSDAVNSVVDKLKEYKKDLEAQLVFEKERKEHFIAEQRKGEMNANDTERLLGLGSSISSSVFGKFVKSYTKSVSIFENLLNKSQTNNAYTWFKPAGEIGVDEVLGAAEVIENAIISQHTIFRNTKATTEIKMESIFDDFDNKMTDPVSVVDFENAIKTLQTKCTSQTQEAIDEITEVNINSHYRPINLNYYYHHTLIEFNYDYVMSLKLFDEKVIIAQLLDQLLFCCKLDLDLSYKQIYVREQIKEMVNRVVETDDTEVDDCFFTFSNDKYDQLMRQSELQRYGLYARDGVAVSDVPIDPTAIMDSLNALSDDATANMVQEVFEGAMKEISGYVTSYKDTDEESIGLGANIDFIGNLLTNLANVLVGAVMSPKVYLLIYINLKLMGENPDFNLDGFIDHFKNFIVKLIRQLRDELIKFLVEELMKILGEIAKEVAVKIGLEQVMYYKRLIERIIKCFKMLKGKGVDFAIDQAVVDIYEQEIAASDEPNDDTCAAFK